MCSTDPYPLRCSGERQDLLCFAVRMIVLDFHGCPQKYDQLKIMSDVVAKERVDGSTCPRCAPRTGRVSYVGRGFGSFGLSSLLRINVFKVDVPREGGRGWKRTSAEVTSNELGEDLLKEVSKGADYVYRETWVPLVLLLSTTPA